MKVKTRVLNPDGTKEKWEPNGFLVVELEKIFEWGATRVVWWPDKSRPGREWKLV